MRWGLVHHWSKAEPPTLNTINARSENLEEGGGMWGSVKGRKRCVVVAQGCALSLSHTHTLPFRLSPEI
jgi:putative SOS response-associated peptidase YedK